MESRPRSDIYINLPALTKLDAMLIVWKAFFCKGLEQTLFSFHCHIFIITWILLDRKYWIVSKIENFGMQNKEACHRIQLVRAHFAELLFSAKRRSGGCQSHASHMMVSLRSRGSTCDTNVTVHIKFTKLPWPLTVAFLLRWKFHTLTWHLFQRLAFLLIK
jgi:hypothetical protein